MYEVLRLVIAQTTTHVLCKLNAHLKIVYVHLHMYGLHTQWWIQDFFKGGFRVMTTYKLY